MRTELEIARLQPKRPVVVAGDSALRAIRWHRRVYGELTWERLSSAGEKSVYQLATAYTSAFDPEQLERQGLINRDDPRLTVAVKSGRNRVSPEAIRCVTLPRAPHGSIMKVNTNLFAYSPALCVLDAARSIDTPRLIMMMEELCGAWSLPETGPIDARQFGNTIDFTDKPCGYFEASPCLAVSELRAFIAHTTGLHGQRRTGTIARHALGNARSPMESIVNLMFSLPHAQGGLNCGKVIPNHKIHLSSTGARIAGMPYVIADAYLPESQTVLEYNGAYHDAPDIRKRDENRTLALQSMGFSVFRINNEQLRDLDALESIARIIFKARGMRYRPRTQNHTMKMQTMLDGLRESVGLRSCR